MATTKITSPDLFDLGSLNTALKLPSGTTAERPTSPSTGEWRYNTTTNLVEFWDGGEWRDLQSEDIPPIHSEHFNVVLYTGNGSTQSITGVGFKPDFVWVKVRSTTGSGPLADSTRGTGKAMYSNLTDADYTFPAGQGVTSFDADGFSVGDDATGNGGYNGSGKTYVAWCWKANGGTTSSNTEGTITSTVQANTKAGFSIVQYTAAAAGSSGTIGHGLSQAPEMIITKRTDAISAWRVGLEALGNWDRYLGLSQTNAYSTSSTIYSAAPTSSVYSIGNDPSMINDTIAYCFHSVAGYSKFGSYTGNGSDNGPIVETGFEPAFVMIKRSSGTSNWQIWDNKRSTTNTRDKLLFPNDSAAEQTLAYVDFLSNGFQIVDASGATGGTNVNINGSTYIYIAFASDQSAAPVLADSFANKLYAGTNATHAITGLGFSPSLVWIKDRGNAEQHILNDSTRGATKDLSTNTTAAEATRTQGFLSFDDGGFTLGSDPSGVVNDSIRGPYVAWAWKANPIPTINTDGTIQSIVSANQASGFSIVKYTGNATSGATVGHGLSNAPDVVIAKGLSGSGSSWWVRDKNVSSTDVLELNSSNAQANYSSVFNNTDPTSTVVTLGSGDTNRNNETQILYCFHSIAGFSKMGTYTGTGATHAITGVGFQPDWIMGKEVDGVDSWEMVDSARGINKMVYANGANAEVTNTNFTSFDSDGFTLSSATSINENGKTYIYMAFKENPVQYAIPSGEMGYLVAAGGGSGANSGAGGGAGGLRTTYGTVSGGGANAETNLTLAAGTYTITVGAGGVSRGAGSSPPAYGGQGLSGSVSTITGVASVSTVGGGGGGSNSQSASPPISASGLDGGSGGGQGPSAASGETPGSGTANEGFGGGTSSLTSPYGSGGGGGAGSAGGNRVGSTPGNGGDGLTISITGSNSGYAGGGGGSGGLTSSFGLGTSGGGNGAPSTGTGISGTANTGGGGGGGGDTRAAGSGGSGIVVLRLNTSDYSGATTGSPTVTTNGSETILTYTGSGTYVHS